MTTTDPEATPPAGIPVADGRRHDTTADESDPRLTPGSIVAGRYEVRRRLGAGGEASVHLAHDRELDLAVVLKTRRFVDDDDLTRLRREAGLLMRVAAHPGLPIVRSDAVDGDRYFMISDHVDGRDLHDVMSAQASTGLPLTTVLDLVDELATTLDHLHAHDPRIVHGDVKPENVVVTSTGRAVLVDFGAAMRVGERRDRMGTVGFSAPEVLAGDEISPASDVYSLAALTVQLLTGVTPRPGAPWPAAMAAGRLSRLERVLRRGLTWDPLGRPWGATAFAGELRAAAEDELPSGTVTLVMIIPATPDGGRDAAAVLAERGGQHVPGPAISSDDVLHVFGRAGEAVGAALDAAAAIGDARFALHAGDLGGPQGATLEQLAATAQDLAAGRPGAVVCSSTVRMLLGAADGLEFTDVDDGGAIVERRTDRAETSVGHADGGGVVVVPTDHADGWIASRRSSTLAGRDDELAEASIAVDRQRAAAAAAVLVVRGEAGMGKTRFLAELAARARDAGELVLVGRSTESGGAFEPFLDALGDDLFPFEQGQLERDEEGWVDRRRFFGRIAAALSAHGRAVTMVLDDVQWIDGSSLALLAQLLDDVGPSLSVLAGCRPNADPRILDELLVRPGATSLTMAPISVGDLATMASAQGLELDADRLDGLHALAAGSPFFASQLLDHLRRAPDGADVASAGVRAWIRERADRLGADAAATLATAATIGRRFDLIVLADVIGESPLAIVDRLDQALSIGLVAESARPGEFAFVHEIVRTELAEALSGTRRGLLHATIARRLEEEGDGLDQLEAALHHWLEADRLGDPLHAGELAARVGTLTTERLAHERAIDVLRRALDVVDVAPATADRDRAEARVRVSLGRALFVATDSTPALDQLQVAADLAQASGDHETLAQAALVASLNRRHGRDDPELLDLLERASERCPDEPAVLSAMLHIRRSRLLPLTVPHEERSAQARRGLEHVDRMEAVDRAMVETEIARACWEPGDAEHRVEVTTRVVDTADEAVRRAGPSRWTGVLIEALNIRWASLVQLGRLSDALDDATRAVAVADEAGTTFLLSRSLMGEAMIRAAIGDHEQAEAASAKALAISDRHNLRLDSMAIAYCIGRDRGAQAELAGLEQALGDLVDSNPLFVAAFALVHAEAGNLDDARRLLDELDQRAPWPRNWVWLATVVSALEAAVLLRDDRRARHFADDLRPFSGQWATAAAELGCWGPIDRVLGLAAGLDGEIEGARRLLMSARDSAAANGATYWLARCHAGLAALTDPGDSSS